MNLSCVRPAISTHKDHPTAVSWYRCGAGSASLAMCFACHSELQDRLEDFLRVVLPARTAAGYGPWDDVAEQIEVANGLGI